MGTWRTTLGEDGLPVVERTEGARPRPTLDLPGRYVDLGHFASGGIGEIRRVRDQKLGTELVMKLLRRAASETQRRRFEREARLTARLHHPNIVPALDLGTLGGGVPWFTMPEVRGRTLREVMDAADTPLRRFVELVEGVARALAYAHGEGVVHRDVKPQNLMVGRFGDVRIMDFGVAMDLADMDRDLDDAVVGTPLYMAPEQARGEMERCGPGLDTYALGVLLYEVLTGAVPYEGDGIQVWHQIIEGPPPDPRSRIVEGRTPPEPLLQLVREMMVRPPEDRLDAEGVANRLRSWLDGEERRLRALDIVRSASPLADEIEALQTRVQRQRELAATVLEPLPSHAPVAEKEAGWLLEDHADRAELELRRVQARHQQRLQAALYQDPDCADAHRGLAAFHRQALERAEREGDPVEEAYQEELLQVHDRGEHAAYLEGRSSVTLHTDPPGAAVVAERLVHRGRRWQVDGSITLGTTPLDEVGLPHGNWRLKIRAPGRVTTTVPVRLRRGDHWHAVPPDDDAPYAIPLPTALDPGEVYVPAGWYETEPDPNALDAFERHRVWVDGFAMRRFPVTVREWRRFVDALGAKGEAHVPTVSNGDAGPAWTFDGKTWSVGSGEVDADDVPVTLVSPVSAQAYADWRAAHDGLAYRLPHELEWEKAARGADKRIYPWGNGFDPALAAVHKSIEGVPRRVAVHAFPTDESVYGVRGLTGNARDICATVWRKASEALGPRVRFETPGPEDLWVVRGGAWASTETNCRCASRMAAEGRRRFQLLSLRLARSIDPS